MTCYDSVNNLTTLCYLGKTAVRCSKHKHLETIRRTAWPNLGIGLQLMEEDAFPRSRYGVFGYMHVHMHASFDSPCNIASFQQKSHFTQFAVIF